jgi:hypothetical protein
VNRKGNQEYEEEHPRDLPGNAVFLKIHSL